MRIVRMAVMIKRRALWLSDSVHFVPWTAGIGLETLVVRNFLSENNSLSTESTMAKSGLLILTQPFSHLRSVIPKVMEEASVAVSDTLYVCLQPALQSQSVTKNSLLQPVICTKEVQSLVKDFYLSAYGSCNTLDIRVLLSHICAHPAQYKITPYHLNKDITVLLSDSSKLQDSWNSEKIGLYEILQDSFHAIRQDFNFCYLSPDTDENAPGDISFGAAEPLQTYPNVVLGGTFDRLHTGHKALLTESCLRCDKKLTVGIVNGERIKKKSVWELMEPYPDRERQLVNFVTDVKPSILLEPVEIHDPFGPTITDPDFQCLVVSEETKAGGDMVNEERVKRGFHALEVITIDLMDDACRSEDEETKISSSSLRKRLLGTLLHPLPSRPHVPKVPYRIAVTGGIASGKSNVCKELQMLGVKIVNCDLLGHKAYVKGTKAHEDIVKAFGEAVVGEDGEIHRPSLGKLVFSDKSKLDTLNSIVWPAIRQLAAEEIELHRKAGIGVVALEAAVLLEAGWDDMVHEVWTTFVPRTDAVQRLIERNKLSQAEAERRIDSQISNEERIARSNVAICPVWEYEITRKQVLKAWTLMQQRMGSTPPSSAPQTKL